MKEKNKRIIFIIIGIIIILLISIFLLYKINMNKELTSFYFENYKSELGVGETTKLDIPSTIDSKNIKYKSSDETIAIVDNNGNVTALSEGNVTISATTEKYKAEANINIITSTSNAQVTKRKTYLKINKESLLGVIDLTNIEPFIRVHTPELDTPQGMCVTDKYIVVTGKGSDVSLKIYDKNKSNPSKALATKKSDYLGHANGLTYVTSEDKIYVADADENPEKYYKVSINDNSKEKSITISTNNTYGWNFTDEKNNGKKIQFGGLAYDNKNKKMYLSNGNTIKEYDIKSKTITKTIYRRFIENDKVAQKDGSKIEYGTQDIAYYNEKILSIRYKNKNYIIDYSKPQTARNAIDIYSTTEPGDNAFLGSFIVKTKKTITGYNKEKVKKDYEMDTQQHNYELESIDVDGDYLYLYFNLLTNDNNYLDKNLTQRLNATHDVYRISLNSFNLNFLKK